MNAAANDLRVLRLAQVHESAFERHLVESTMPLIGDAQAREDLAPLLPEGESHSRRIAREIERLHDAAGGPESAADAQRAAIMDIVEAERASRTEFLWCADRVHDQALAKLFRDLADEEARHVRVAERALARLEERILREQG